MWQYTYRSDSGEYRSKRGLCGARGGRRASSSSNRNLHAAIGYHILWGSSSYLSWIQSLWQNWSISEFRNLWVGNANISIFAESDLLFNYVITKGKMSRSAFYHAFGVWNSIVDLDSRICWQLRTDQGCDLQATREGEGGERTWRNYRVRERKTWYLVGTE